MLLYFSIRIEEEQLFIGILTRCRQLKGIHVMQLHLYNQLVQLWNQYNIIIKNGNRPFMQKLYIIMYQSQMKPGSVVQYVQLGNQVIGILGPKMSFSSAAPRQWISSPNQKNLCYSQYFLLQYLSITLKLVFKRSFQGKNRIQTGLKRRESQISKRSNAEVISSLCFLSSFYRSSVFLF